MSRALRSVSHSILAASLFLGAVLNAATAAEPADAERGATLSGRIVDAEGRPITGADVRLHQWDFESARFTAAEAELETGGSGSYRFASLPEGRYVLVASAAGLANSFRTTPVEKDADLSIDVVLRQPVVSIIELRDARDRPVADARLRELRMTNDEARMTKE